MKHLNDDKCICPMKCDCQDFKKGYVSEECPEHNITPNPHPNCTAEIHENGASYRNITATASHM